MRGTEIHVQETSGEENRFAIPCDASACGVTHPGPRRVCRLLIHVPVHRPTEDRRIPSPAVRCRANPPHATHGSRTFRRPSPSGRSSLRPRAPQRARGRISIGRKYQVPSSRCQVTGYLAPGTWHLVLAPPCANGGGCVDCAASAARTGRGRHHPLFPIPQRHEHRRDLRDHGIRPRPRKRLARGALAGGAGAHLRALHRRRVAGAVRGRVLRHDQPRHQQAAGPHRPGQPGRRGRRRARRARGAPRVAGTRRACARPLPVRHRPAHAAPRAPVRRAGVHGQRQAHPRVARHRHPARGAALLPPRRLGAAHGERAARAMWAWASSGRSSPGTFPC